MMSDKIENTVREILRDMLGLSDAQVAAMDDDTELFGALPELDSMAVAVWSGDTVRRDADGLLYFVGRGDAMIKTSGNRVSPTEIEEAAVESGLVAEACALGRKDERLGAAIVLFVRGSGDDEALKAHLKATLPNFMQPAELVWLEAFPKSANGKVDRNVLAEGLGG